MKIAIIGSGGVGGYFGARLSASGEDVTFIARGAHLDAMNTNGLKVLSALGDLHLPKVKAATDTKTIGQVDVVMIAVKLWSTEEAAQSARPLIGPQTVAVSFQNGVVAVDTLVPILGKAHVMGGVANIAALIEAPGVIRHNGAMANLFFGELDGSRSARSQGFYEACKKANINTELVADVHRAIWEKFVRLVTLSAMTSLTRMPAGPLRADPDTRALMQQVMEEVIAVGRAKGVKFEADIAAKQMSNIDSIPPTMVASMCGDLRRGNRLELPWLSGTVAKLGKELGIPTPANQFVYAALKLYANGRPAEAQI
ncbi:MAG: 2-dehydropantoate 2-reductase [Betaproteobacteria bacterium]|nr:2-dehydropantoate 2-reductase [Betaproteobacteria bacterium]